jgi:AraC-like DNA-binding protein
MTAQNNEPAARNQPLTQPRQALAQRIAAHAPLEGENDTGIPSLVLFRRTAPSACCRTTCEPSLTVFAQGRKVIRLGGQGYLCGASSFLLSAIEIPVQSQIIEASAAEPLLSMSLRLDMATVREVLSRQDFPETHGRSDRRALAVGETTIGLLTACGRLIDLIESPEDIPFLSPMIQREVIYRLLKTPQAERLRAVATAGDLSHRTARAVAWLVANYASPLRMEELAGTARMAVSTLHHQFRALTAMSPLQYQKQLRLQAARQRMLIGGLDATRAAYEVGYESASQFSREYSRFFGQPPMKDVRALRSALISPPATQ